MLVLQVFYLPRLTSFNLILGCLLEQDTHYDKYDVDYSEDIPDKESCRLFCKEKSKYFTFMNDDIDGLECYCKSSNEKAFSELGTVSGETDCQSGE